MVSQSAVFFFPLFLFGEEYGRRRHETPHSYSSRFDRAAGAFPSLFFFPSGPRTVIGGIFVTVSSPRFSSRRSLLFFVLLCRCAAKGVISGPVLFPLSRPNPRRGQGACALFLFDHRKVFLFSFREPAPRRFLASPSPPCDLPFFPSCRMQNRREPCAGPVFFAPQSFMG